MKSKCPAVYSLTLWGSMFLFVQAGNGQTITDPGLRVIATNKHPDRVATHLMPVPIFNFAVHNLAFSPDGRTLATGAGTGIVRLWDVKRGTMTEEIAAHTNWAFSVTWSRDGKSLVTGGGDDLVRIFSTKNGFQPVRTFRGHKGDVHAVVMTPDRQRLISAGDDRQIIIWKVNRDEPDRQWIAHEKQIPTLALSPNGDILASGSRDHTIRLWNPRTGNLQETLTGHTGDVMSVRFSPNGKWLASASYDQSVRLWNVKTGKPVSILKGHTNRAFNVSFSPDGTRLASAGDSTVRIWDVARGNQLKVFSYGGEIVSDHGTTRENLSAVAFNPDGKSLAIASTTGVTLLVSVDTGAIISKLVPPPHKTVSEHKH